MGESPLAPLLRVVPMRAFVEVGTPRGWGEGWWTAADLALTHPVNDPELPDPYEIRLGFDRREAMAFLMGTESAGRD